MSVGVGAFARKELRELARDRRAIFTTVVLPVLLYPAIFSLTGSLERGEEERTEARVVRVALAGDAFGVGEALRARDDLEVRAAAGEDDLAAALEAGEIEVGVFVPAAMGTAKADGAKDGGGAKDAGSADGSGEDDVAGAPGIRVSYHGARDRSREARDRVVETIQDARRRERDRRFAARGGEGPLGAFAVRSIDVATETETGGAQAGRLLPYLLVVTLFAAAASLSVDVVAGEKERGTLETLYLAPVPRGVIARAKLLVVAGSTVVTGSLNVASMVLCYRLGLIESSATGGGLSISGGALVASFLLIVPLSVLVGGVVLGISAYARTVKEAQHYVTPAILVSIVPGLLASSQDVRLDLFTALIPVANVSLAVRDSLIGEVAPGMLAVVGLASLAWGFLAAAWTARILSREETILGFDPEPILAHTPTGRRRAALLGMAATVLVYFYGGVALQTRDLVWGLVASLWVLLPLLGAGTLRLAWNGGSLRKLLSLRAPGVLPVLGGALLGAGCVLPMSEGVARFQDIFLPAPEGLFEGLETGFDHVSLPAMLFLLAVSPGICEELVFRGAFLGLLRKVGTTRAAVLISSAYFGLIHLSVYRLVPTFLLGLALAAITVRTRSIFPAMVFHMAYNGLAFSQAWREGEQMPALLAGPQGWIATAVFLGLGALAIARGRRAGDESAA